MSREWEIIRLLSNLCAFCEYAKRNCMKNAELDSIYGKALVLYRKMTAEYACNNPDYSTFNNILNYADRIVTEKENSSYKNSAENDCSGACAEHGYTEYDYPKEGVKTHFVSATYESENGEITERKTETQYDMDETDRLYADLEKAIGFYIKEKGSTVMTFDIEIIESPEDEAVLMYLMKNGTLVSALNTEGGLVTGTIGIESFSEDDTRYIRSMFDHAIGFYIEHKGLLNGNPHVFKVPFLYRTLFIEDRELDIHKAMPFNNR